MDDWETLYRDEHIIVGTEGDGMYYLTLIHNQTMIRMDYQRFKSFLDSIGRYERDNKKFSSKTDD